MKKRPRNAKNSRTRPKLQKEIIRGSAFLKRRRRSPQNSQSNFVAGCIRFSGELKARIGRPNRFLSALLYGQGIREIFEC